MEKILGIVINKKEATMSDCWIVEDLSSWELINPSDDDENEDYSYDELDLYVLESLSPILSAQFPPLEPMDHASDHEDRVDLAKHVSIDEQCVYNDYDYEEEEEEELEEDYGGEFDLDDELVPRNVSDRFGRQRIRKVGKRAYPKMNKSKKLPYSYNRPGCVHGKHGLGLKHTIVN